MKLFLQVFTGTVFPGQILCVINIFMHQSTECIITQEVLSAFLSSSTQHKRASTPLAPLSLYDMVIAILPITTVRYIIKPLFYNLI